MVLARSTCRCSSVNCSWRRDMKISVVVPAHNEEKYIRDCIASIRHAEEHISTPVELIVCLNRCSDRTEEIARDLGAIIAREEAKNIAKIRNAGARAARGDIIVTIDADSRMSSKMLSEIERLILTRKYIGGGTIIRAERLSAGIIASGLMVLLFAMAYGLRSAGLFWCLKQDFDAIGGFDESKITVEDLDFANRLAALGRTKGLKYGTVRRAHIVTFVPKVR